MDSPRRKGSRTLNDPRIAAIPDTHGHAKGEHKPYAEERPIAYSPRMLFLWFYHACRRGSPRFLMVSDHINYLTFEDPGAVHTVRRALKLAEAGDLHGAAETAGVEVAHAAVVSQGLRRGMRFSIGAELDNDPRSRPDAQNIVDAMRPDGMIRSVHFLTIEHPEKGPEFQWPFDNPEFKDLYDSVGTERVWELYTAKLIDDVEKLPGNIVGHFYVPGIFGHWPEPAKLEAYEDRLLDACAARGMAVEINTRVFYREYPPEIVDAFRNANLRLMRKAKAKGVAIAIGADAHSPKDQGGAFDVVLAMLDEAEINEIVFPVAGRLARVALRATKEHLEKLKAQEPATVQPGSSISGLGRAELGLPERGEAEEKAAAKLGHDAGPKKRAASPARATKRPSKKKAAEGLPEGSGPAAAAPEAPVEEPGAAPSADETAKAPRTTRSRAGSTSKKTAAKAAAPPEPEPAPAPEPAPEPKPSAKKPVVKTPAAKTAAKPAKAVKAVAVAKTTKAAKTAAPASKKAAATKTAKPASKSAAKNVKATKTTAAAKKTAAKAPAKKAPAVKKAAPKKAAPAKKAPAKKAAAKKAPARKAAPAKRAPAKKAPAKPAAKKAASGSKKTSAKKSSRRR